MLNVLLWCYSLPGVGSKLVRHLWETYRGRNDVTDAILHHLRKSGIIEGTRSITIDQDMSRINETLVQLECEVIPFWSDTYPAALRRIPDFPAFIFKKGNRDIPEKCIGIVGTRAMSEYGRHVVSDIVRPLVHYEVGIVSGLAYGVDAAVHLNAISAEAQSIPIAVLPGGPVDGIPNCNRSLYEKILEHGCVLWEFLPGIQLVPNLFACRNRLIAGLSCAVVVIESDVKGGSLITAQSALDYGRDVCAVPGSVYSRTSRGTNSLLRDGAYLVRNGFDALEVIGIDDTEGARMRPSIVTQIIQSEIGIDEQMSIRIVNGLKEGGKSLDSLSKYMGVEELPLRHILTKLELKGILRRNAAGLIILGDMYP